MQHDSKREIIRRKKTIDNGLYIRSKVQGINMIFTADTGATKTVISDRVYRKIPEDQRPTLHPTTVDWCMWSTLSGVREGSF
jgi:predicted aspartyl protease